MGRQETSAISEIASRRGITLRNQPFFNKILKVGCTLRVCKSFCLDLVLLHAYIFGGVDCIRTLCPRANVSKLPILVVEHYAKPVHIHQFREMGCIQMLVGAAIKDKPPHLARLVKPHRLAW